MIFKSSFQAAVVAGVTRRWEDLQLGPITSVDFLDTDLCVYLEDLLYDGPLLLADHDVDLVLVLTLEASMIITGHYYTF